MESTASNTEKITVRRILTVQEALTEILNMKLTARAAFELSRAFRPILRAVEDYDSARSRLFLKLGSVDEKTQDTTIPKENIEQFRLELEQLLETPVDIKTPVMSMEQLLEHLGDGKISALYIHQLEQFFH